TPGRRRWNSRQPQPRDSLCACASGAPQNVTRALIKPAFCGSSLVSRSTPQSSPGPLRTLVCKSTGAFANGTKNPKRAGSPACGSTLKTGAATVNVCWDPGVCAVTEATPTAACSGHSESCPSPSLIKNCHSGQRETVLGSATKPTGRCAVICLAASAGPTDGEPAKPAVSGPWSSAIVPVTWKECEPACVSGVPPSSSGVSSYSSTPNGDPPCEITTGRVI